MDWGTAETSMLLTVHNLAKTYGLMPSEIMSRATTFDLYVLDVSTRHSKYQQDVAQGRSQRQTPGLTIGKMQDMIQRARMTECE
jgi:hypothetical protein